MSHPAPTIRATLLTTIAAITLFGASALVYRTSHANPPPVAAQAATPVGVHTLEAQNIRLWSSFSGRARAVDYAEIRPEVSGRITEVRFADGQLVKAGDILFVIDPQTYVAAVARAEAKLASAVSAAAFAKAEYERAASMIPNQTIPVRVYDQRANDDRVAKAAVLSAEADLKQAKIDVDHAYVKAPISGRVSRAEITVGNLVQSALNAPTLTTIASTDGMYVDFEVDEQTYLANVRAHAGTSDKEQTIPVEVTAQGEADHIYRGHIQSFDNRIDTGSGTIRARAKFANDDDALVPGMFVSVRLAGSRDVRTVLVPERAIGTDQAKKFVYVVGADNKVAYREAVVGQQVGGERVVISGLAAGDRVVVDGLQHVRPDIAVDAHEVDVKDVTTVAAN